MIPTTWKSRSFKEDRRQVNRRFHYLTRVSGKCLAPITDLAAFGLLELITHGLDKPDAAPPPAVIAAMIAIETIGIVAMAFVLLGRLEAAFSRLNAQTNRQPVAWRRLAVILSIACLLLTDILANVAAAFAGAGFLLIAAVPTFLASLACKGIAFAGIPGGQDRAD